MSILETFPANAMPVGAERCAPEPDRELVDLIEDRAVWGSDTVEDCFLSVAGFSDDPRPVSNSTPKVDPIPAAPAILLNRRVKRPKPVGELALSVKTGQVYDTLTRQDNFAFSAAPQKVQPEPRRARIAGLFHPGDLVDELVFQRPTPVSENPTSMSRPTPRPVKAGARRKGAFFLTTG